MRTIRTDNILWHGTSLARFESIQKEDLLRLPSSGDQKISFTPEPIVALYWACLAARTDTDEGQGDGAGVLIPFDQVALERAGYALEEFRDGIFGAGECDWEQEICCWREIPGAMRFALFERLHVQEYANEIDTKGLEASARQIFAAIRPAGCEREHVL